MNPAERTARYAGRPLLILLENYVLAVIGGLPGDHEAKVASAVVRHFGGDATAWRETLKAKAGLPEDFDQRISAAWRPQPPGVNPNDFVLAIADANFVDLIDPS